MSCKVTVIIPVYRVEPYIARCCHSLFSQKLGNMEFIFVDDASPDRSVDIIKEVLLIYPERKSFVKLIRHPENKGVASARNSGLEAATGEYIAYVDADDYIEPDMFELLYTTAKGGNLDIVGCDWYMEFKSSRRYIKQPEIENGEDGLLAMLGGRMRWYLWAFIVKRSIYEMNTLRFLEGANIGEDMFAMLRCFSYAHTYRHVPCALYHYVKYNGSSLTNVVPKMQMELVEKNVDATISFIHARYPEKMRRELDFLRLNVKFPLLITDEVECYDYWNQCYSEANHSVWCNKSQTLRNKILQWAAMHRFYWILKAHYRFLFKFVYGVLYK